MSCNSRDSLLTQGGHTGVILHPTQSLATQPSPSCGWGLYWESWMDPHAGSCPCSGLAARPAHRGLVPRPAYRHVFLCLHRGLVAGNRTVYSRPALHRATLAIMSSQDPPVCLAQCLAWNKASHPLWVSIGSPTGLVIDSWVAVLSLALQFGPSNNPCKTLGTAHGSSCKGNYKPEKDACQAAYLTDLQSPRDCSMNPLS